MNRARKILKMAQNKYLDDIPVDIIGVNISESNNNNIGNIVTILAHDENIPVENINIAERKDVNNIGAIIDFYEKVTEENINIAESKNVNHIGAIIDYDENIPDENIAVSPSDAQAEVTGSTDLMVTIYPNNEGCIPDLITGEFDFAMCDDLPNMEQIEHPTCSTDADDTTNMSNNNSDNSDQYNPSDSNSELSNEDFSDENIEPEPELDQNATKDTDPNMDNSENSRKRKKVADKETWIREKNRKKRMRGENYLGFSKKQNEKMKQDTMRNARKLKPTCNSEFCKKSKLRNCSTITDTQRKKLFDYFWQEMSWDQRKVYVSAHVEKIPVKRKTSNNPRRQGTFLYYLNINNRKIQICRTMFLNTFDLGYKTVQEWVNHSNDGMHQDQERKRTVRKTLNRKLSSMENIDSFLDELPKLPSHYSRKDCSKLFLEPIFKSLVSVYNLYKEYCINKNFNPLTKKYFYRRFKEKNLAIYQLKKDQCNICCAYNTGNISEESYIEHRNRKDRARQEKENDKIRAVNGECVALCIDLQAVKLAPYLEAGAFYYKTKLCVHNFTVYDLKTHNATCYWFSEDQNSQLKASTFVSCLLDYLEKKCLAENLPIIIYSDGCTYQNRNNILSNAILNFSLKHNATIYQKYLETGHTYMECDSVHASIERKLKNREIHLPSDYLSVTREARQNPRPYEAIDLDFSFFSDFSSSEHLRYPSIRPGRQKDEPTVTDIKSIKYENGKIRVKVSYDTEWQDLPARPKEMPVIATYPRMHNQRCKIPPTKWKHLQELKTVLPKDVHHFYDNLPH